MTIIVSSGFFCELRWFGLSLAMTAETLSSSLVAPDESSRVYARWGLAAFDGYQPIPDVLLQHQGELGLSSEDLNVLLQITSHWYLPEKMPFPRPTSIANRMGVSVRTVQRSLSRLQEKGFISKATNPEGKKIFDLKPLVAKLQPLAEKRLRQKQWRSSKPNVISTRTVEVNFMTGESA